MNIQRILLVLALALLVVPVTAQAASLSKAPNNLGLVGYWSFNDGTGLKATDFSGQGNHGTLTSGPSWVTGKLGYGLRFDGTDDYVVLGTGAVFNVSAVSLSAWIKTTYSGADQYIVARGYDGVVTPWAIRVSDNKAKVHYFNVGEFNSESTSNVNDGAWHHIVGTISSTGSTAIYVDGVLQDSDARAASLPTNSAAVNIGSRESVLWPFNGSIDDVRIYNRALGANEVARLYASGASAGVARQQGINTNGLVGHWSFDECKGTSAQDVSVQGNNVGALSGFAYTGTTSNWVSGTNAKRGCALAFDGSDDALAFPVVPVGTTHTYSAWIKPNAQSASYGSLFGATGGGVGYFYRGSDAGADAGKITYWIGSNLLSSVALNDQQWNHVAVSVTAGAISFYINGVAAGTQAGGLAFSAVAMGSSGGFLFKGSLDDVRIYNRALSAAEIKGIYNEPANEIRKVTVGTSSNKLTQGTSLATGLVGHWTFDGADLTGSGGTGTARDASGNGNHGALTNGPTRTLGKLGQALSFDGVNDYVDNGNPAVLRLTSTVSVSAWIKMRSVTNGLLVHELGGYSLGYNFQTIGGASQRFNFGMLKTSWTIANSVTSPTLNTWYHVVGVYDGTNGKIYVNGVLEATSATVAAPIDTGYGSVIGAYSGGQGSNADIDDARIYNRALSAAEVKQLYNLAR